MQWGTAYPEHSTPEGEAGGHRGGGRGGRRCRGSRSCGGGPGVIVTKTIVVVDDGSFFLVDNYQRDLLRNPNTGLMMEKMLLELKALNQVN